MSKLIKTTLLFGTVLLSACQRGAEIPVQIRAPIQATDAHLESSADSSSHEFVFRVSSKRDDYSLVDQIESQLIEAGFARCVAGKGIWETLAHDRDGRTVSENRLIRFYKTSNPRQLGMILVRQYCDEKQSPCKHKFVVRQIDIPESIPEGDRYVREICENRSQIVDPGSKLQFP